MFLESPNGYIDPAPSVVSNLKTVPTTTHPPELTPPPEWMRESACLGNFELFDSLCEDLRQGPRLREAKQICSGCPVKDLCLQMALDAELVNGRFRYGVFGGKTPDERDEMAGRVRHHGWADKQWCVNGHQRTQENTAIRKNGTRLCRDCTRSSRQRRRAKAKAGR